MTEISTPTPQTVWRHYKGGLYVVIGYCRIEATNTPAVLYQAVGERWPVVWCRPVLDWCMEIKGRPRFLPVDARTLDDLVTIARGDG